MQSSKITLFFLGLGASVLASASPRLETIVVQGEKSHRMLGETTSLVGVVYADKLDSGAVEHASQLFVATPGIWVSRGNGQEQLTAIRSPVLTGAGACGAFAMSEDGIALRANGFCNLNQLFDSHLEVADYVEVLKGPYSSLVGGNAQFGAINVQLPLADQVDNRLQMSGTDAGYRRLGLNLADQLGQHALAFLSSAAEDDGLQDNSGFSQQKISLRHDWTGTQWLSVENALSVMHLEQETAGYIEGKGAYKDPVLRKQNPNPNAYRDADSLRAYSRWRYRKLDREWVITPYLRRNDMAFLMHFVPWQPVEENSHDSLGWQLQWRRYLPQGGELFVSQEAERTWGELTEIQYSEAPFAKQNFPVGRHYDFGVVADNLALSAGGFGFLNNSLALDAAARLDYTHYDYHTNVPAGSACSAAATACRFYRPESQNTEFLEPSAHIGLVNHWQTNRYWFAKAAAGYRVPQVTELYRAQSAEQADISAERSRSIELGLRGQSGYWFAQGAMFAMRNYDGIVQSPERLYINGVDSRHQGFEYQVVFDGNGWFFEVAGQIADHEYLNNPTVLGVDVTLRGKQMDTAPKHMHSVSLKRELEAKHTLGVQSYWLGEHYLDPQNEFVYEGHFLTDVQWQWQISKPLSTSLNILNVFDRRYAERADVSFDDYRYFPGLQRRVSVTLKYEF